jgi:hypothetical protein
MTLFVRVQSSGPPTDHEQRNSLVLPMRGACLPALCDEVAGGCVQRRAHCVP